MFCYWGLFLLPVPLPTLAAVSYLLTKSTVLSTKFWPFIGLSFPQGFKYSRRNGSRNASPPQRWLGTRSGFALWGLGHQQGVCHWACVCCCRICVFPHNSRRLRSDRPGRL